MRRWTYAEKVDTSYMKTHMYVFQGNIRLSKLYFSETLNGVEVKLVRMQINLDQQKDFFLILLQKKNLSRHVPCREASKSDWKGLAEHSWNKIVRTQNCPSIFWGGCWDPPAVFVPDCAAVFGTPYRTSFPHTLWKFQIQVTQGQVTRSRQVTSSHKKFECSSKLHRLNDCLETFSNWYK